MIASHRGHVKCVQLLLEKGALVNDTNEVSAFEKFMLMCSPPLCDYYVVRVIGYWCSGHYYRCTWFLILFFLQNKSMNFSLLIT